MASKQKVSDSTQAALAQFIIICIASATLSTVVFIIRLTDQAQTISSQGGSLSGILTLDASTTLAIVSALQGLLTFVSAAALSHAFSYIQWAHVGSPRGASYLRVLAASPNSSAWGTIRLIIHKSSVLSARVCGLSRLLLRGIVWLGGIVLFFRTSLVTVFDAGHTYPVTAGVGPFNASYVTPFFEHLQSLAPDYPFSVLPYSYYGQVHNLITNTFYATPTEPRSCGPDAYIRGYCSAYLLSGGVVGTTPWIPGRYPSYPEVLIKNVPMIYVEFNAMNNPHAAAFNEESACQTFGSNTTKIAIKFCLAQSGPASIDAGVFLCAEGISTAGKCQGSNIAESPSSAPNLTTTFSFHRRLGDVLSAKANLTILSVTNVTDFPEQQQQQHQPEVSLSTADFEAYRSVLNWLLNYAAANIPAPSSPVEYFWSASDQLQHPETYASSIILREFRSILVFPLWLFNANSYGNAAHDERIMQNDLPPEFYTTASLVKSYTKIKFDDTVVGLFVAMEGIALLFGWMVWGWVLIVVLLRKTLDKEGQDKSREYKDFPAVSSFPLFDAQFKAYAQPQGEVGQPHNGDHNRGEQDQVWGYNDEQILESMSKMSLKRKGTGRCTIK